MPFLLDGNPSQGEISEAVNYLLSNFTQSVAADPNTGQVIGPGGEIQYYLYKYMFVKYADSFDGSVGFSNTPTNKGYYGLRNSDSSTESTNPVDYVWTQVSGGFGTTKFLYYLTTGGRAIQFQVATAVPNPGWVLDSGAAIDLDVTLATNSVANFVVIRLANNSAAPTDAECVTAIGRTPISGDLCTINYNSGIASITYKYTSGWAIFQKYITGDLIVADSIVGNNIKGGTITADKLFSTYIQVGGAASDVNSGVTTISGGKITANSIAADRLSVSQLSAITANMGTITAGTLSAGTVFAGSLSAATGTFTGDVTVGSSPAISGTTMTGTGSRLYSDGKFITGNSTTNLVFDGSSLTLNGVGNATFGGLNSGIQMPLSPSGTAPTGFVDSFVISKAGFVQITLTGEVLFLSNTTAYPGIYAPVTVSLRSIPGGVLPGSFTGTYDTFNIRLETPVVKPSFGAATNRLQLPLSWTRITNLSVGTYAIFICSDAAFYDTAGNLGYAVPVADRLFNGRIDVFQPTV